MSPRTSPLVPLVNYARTGARRLRQLAWVYVLNLGCLWAGLTVAVLACTYARQELTFDAFHEKAGSLYRLESFLPGWGGRPHPEPQVDKSWAPAMARELDEVLRGTRVWRGIEQVRARPGGAKEWCTILFVDSGFFEMFDFGVSAREFHSLPPSHWMFVTERMADRLGLSPDTPGQSLLFLKERRGWTGLEDDPKEIEISVPRVIPHPPPNSSIRFDALARWELREELGLGLEGGQTGSFLEIPRDEDLAAVRMEADKLAATLPSRYSEPEKVVLAPLRSVHFGRRASHVGDQPAGDWNEFLAILFAAGLLLAACCVTYGTLGSAAVLVRLREIGVRRVVGASPADLRRQFHSEAMALTLAAAGAALVSAFLLAPAAGEYLGREIAPFSQPATDVVIFVAVVIGLGLVCGTYATAVAARKHVDLTVADARTVRGRSRGAAALVAGQCALAVFVLSCTLTSRDQVSYLREKGLGFAGRDLIEVGLGQLPRRAFVELSRALEHQGGITGVTASDQLPGLSFSNDVWKAAARTMRFDFLRVEAGFESTIGLTLAEGRWLDPERDSPSGSIVVNETFLRTARSAGESLGVGDRLTGHDSFYGPYEPVIVGVARDFHNWEVTRPVAPVALALQASGVGSRHLLVRARPGERETALATLRAAWSAMLPGQEFRPRLVGDHVADPGPAEGWVRLFRYLAFAASAVALASVAGFVAAEGVSRSREVSLRRAIGGSIAQVGAPHVLRFGALALAGSAVAIPVAWLALDSWLGRFPYHISPGLLHFAAPVFAVLLVGELCVAWQVVRASRVSPAELLKV